MYSVRGSLGLWWHKAAELEAAELEVTNVTCRPTDDNDE